MSPDYSSLIQKIDSFCKLAGIITVPDHILKEVQQWATGCYADELNQCINREKKKLLHEIKKIERLKGKYNSEETFNIEKYRELLNKLNLRQVRLVNFGLGKYKAIHKFKITASDFPHIRMHQVRNSLNKLTFVGVFMPVFEPEAKGEWKENKNDFHSNMVGTLYIYGDVVYDFNAKLTGAGLDDILDTVRHELVHLIQSIIARLHNLSDIAGLPSRKIRNTDYDYFGNSYNTTINNEDTRVQHELRDIEFYTRLSDSISNFNKLLKYVPKELNKSYAKYWTAQINIEELETIITDYLNNKTKNSDELPQEITHDISRSFRMAQNNDRDLFFNKLYEFQPLKYQKAIKEFYKAVGL